MTERRKQGGPDIALTARFAGLLAQGVPFATACTDVGIAERTAHHWLAKGKSGRRPYAAFARAVTAARSSRQTEGIQHANE